MKFKLGASNSVAGVIDWRIMLNSAYGSFQCLPAENVLSLRIEDAHKNLPEFSRQIDDFMKVNFGISKLDELLKEMDHSLKPIKSYPQKGCIFEIVKKLAQNLNSELGYNTPKIPFWQDRVFVLLATPFVLFDRFIRAFRAVKRKLQSSI